MRKSTPKMNLVTSLVIQFISLISFSANAQQQFDVALIKTTITNAPVKYGTPIPFNLTVTNQGTDTITNVLVIDHFGDGYNFQPSLNSGWEEHPTILNAVTSTITELIPPGEERTLTVNLTAQAGDSRDDWINTAEVVDFTDRFGTSQEAMDTDSNGDEIPDNDAGGLLGSEADNEIIGDGTGGINDGVAITDEDDHDRDTIQIFDLALTKVLDPITGYSYGDTLTFTTTVYNQGNIELTSVRVRDIIPEGYENPVDVNTAEGWTNDEDNPIFTFASIPPFSQVSVDLRLILDQTQADGDAWVNYAEVISARTAASETLPSLPLGASLDADSQMASNTDGERSVSQGDAEDNQILNTPIINASNPQQDVDQDDHDPAEPVIFDLALIKERATALSSFNYGTPIEYSYTVVNQGNVSATDILLRDSLPCGAIFDPLLNPDWSYDDATRIATLLLPGPIEPLAAGSTAHIITGDLILTVIGCFEDQETAWTNYMEIAQATTSDGVQFSEIDGEFDNNFSNDAGGVPLTATDNALDGRGIIDEDNHDVELLQVYDLALKKELVTAGPFVEGQDLDFRIRVYNQGNIIIEDLIIEDFIPEGYGFNLADNTGFGWTTSYSTLVAGVPTVFPDTLNVMEDVFLATEDSIDIMIRLQLELDGRDISDWYNFAHVWVATDTVGNNRFDDADSNPFTPTELEFAVIPDSPEDNNIFSPGKSVIPQVEEDDHDVANVDYFDLGLTKTLTSTPTAFGQEVTFDIVVRNEGVQFAHDITVADYVPCGFSFNAGNNMGWVVNGTTGNPEFFYTDTLFAGEAVTIPISLTIEECTMPTTDSYRNVAEISGALNDDDIEGDDQDSTPDNQNPDEDDQDDAFVPVFDLALEKTINTPPASFAVGSPVIYDIIVTNEGNLPALNTEITDFLPCGLDFSTTGNAGWNEDAITGNVSFVITSIIEPGMSMIVPLTLTIGTCTGEPLDLNNIVEITEDNDPDGPIDDFDSTPDNGDPDEDDIDDAPLDFFDLALEKTLTTSTAALDYGQNLDYEIIVTNEGSIEATSFTVTDYLSCGLGFVANNGWTLDVPSGNITRTINTPLLPGESVTLDLTLTLEECAMPAIGSWNNIAEISEANDPDGPADDQDSTPDNQDPDEDDQDDAVLPVFDLSLTKTISTPPVNFMVGSPVSYEIVITNEGNTSAFNIEVTDFLPCGLDFSATGNTGWSEDGTTGNISFVEMTEIAPGGSVIIPLTLTIGSCIGEPLDLENLVEVTDNNFSSGPIDDIDSTPDNGDPDEDDIDTAELAFFDLSLEKTLTTNTTSLTYGQNLNYEITVTNEGSIEATSFTVTDYLSCGLGFVANNGWILDLPTGNITRSINTPLLPGESVTLDLTLRLEECAMPTTDSWLNVAEITAANDPDGPADDEDSTPNNNDPDEDDQDDAPLEVGDLALSKSHTDPAGPIGIGTPIDYNIVVTNQGNVDMVDFVVTDYVPCGLGFTTTGNPGWSAAGNNAQFTVTTPLAPGASVILSLTLTIQDCLPPATPNYVNGAEVSVQGPNPDDPDSTPDDDPENDPPTEDDFDEDPLEWYDLNLTKTSNNTGDVRYGDVVIYTMTVTNQGSLAATDVEVTDYLACGLRFDPSLNPNWSLDANTGFVNSTFTGTIAPRESRDFSLSLIVEPCATINANAYRNVAEISGGDDPSGNPGDDEDSNPDDNPNNDPPTEDDIDDEPLDIFDLSLLKSVTSAQAVYELGQDVSYNIEVTNEGNISGTGVEVTDYIPCGMTLSAANTLPWIVGTDGYARLSVTGVIAVNQSRNFEIILTVGECAMESGTRINLAEISDSDETDADSTPDDDPDNDPEDEDDNDDVEIEVNVGSTIGDFVFNDTDGDGIQDTNESGIGGVVVTLFNADDEVIAVFETGPDGFYEFEEIDAGNYYITFQVDDEFIPSPPNAGNDANDSNVTEENGPGSTPIFEVISGQDDLTIDAGFFVCSLIKGVSYYDVNEDDIRQPTENGINGLVVNLYRRVNGQNVLWDSETTHHDYDTPSDDGIWDFCVGPGQYFIEVVMPPIGLVRVRPFIGGPNFDSDINGGNGPNTTSTFTISPGGSKTDLGAGYYPMATVGNSVWHDENHNGIQEEAEPKMAGVTVQVYDMDHVLLDEAITNAEGIYKVEYLEKQEYYLKFEAPAGFAFTYADATNDELDSDVNHAMGYNTTSPRFFNPGDEIDFVDAGLVNGVLPLRWKQFSVSKTDRSNLLDWTTSQELNVDKFIIERRFESENEFSEIGSVKAIGNSVNDHSYTFDDLDVNENEYYYYRIKQIDFDGQSSFSDIKSIDRRSNGVIKNFPNPAKESFIVSGLTEDESYEVHIINSAGLSSKRFSIVRSQSEEKIDILNLTAGLYEIIIKNDGLTVYQNRLIKIN